MVKAVESASDGFVPLQQRVGMFACDFMRAHAGRDLVIWGAGVLGRCLMRQLAPHATPGQTLVFTDSDSSLAGATIDGSTVTPLGDAIRRARDGAAFLLVALAAHTRSTMVRLAEAGLRSGVDFDSYLKLSRPEAVIQVAGRDCEGAVLMSLQRFLAVLGKLKTDIPDLFHVDLSGRGDPLDHPDISAIVEATREVVPCTLTTRLDADLAMIERALLAAPTQFVIVVEGEPDTAFYDRLLLVAELMHQLRGRTDIRVRYTRFRDNGAGYATLRARCGSLGLKLVEAIGYIDPYDTTLQLCESGDLDAAEAMRLAWPLREALGLAYLDRARPCLCQRIFPVINPDSSAGVCHLYMQPRLHDDYLAVAHDTLLGLRHDAAHCRTCQHHALHRLDVDVLQARHGKILIPAPETMNA